MTGRLIAVVGPSGAGKDTVLAGVKAARSDIRFVRRVITRPTSAGGEDFTGVAEAEFTRMQKQGAFALDWRAHGLCYGIPAEIDKWLAAGQTVAFNGSRAMISAARAVYPELEVILITAPAPVLAARLAARGRETTAEIEARLSRAPLNAADLGAHHVVVNDGSITNAVAACLRLLQPRRA